MGFRNYLSIARPDHWFKNIFVIPGVIAAAVFSGAVMRDFALQLVLGLSSTCLIASANYTINEWLDARFDRFHPVKKNRPSVSGKIKAPYVVMQYLFLATAGLTLAWQINFLFLTVSAFFLLMGFLYNVRPFRTKDLVFLDVLSESINNPVRLLLGWFIVTTEFIPPSSLLLGYWMGGAFLMGIKRFAEYRFIADPESAALYRRSFRHYNEENLLISSFFYGMCSLFFTGIFLIKYRIELILTIPFLAFLFAWYMHIGVQPNSPAQHPERLYREKPFVAYLFLLAVLLIVLMFVDLPYLQSLLVTIFE